MWDCNECNAENEMDPAAEEEQIIECIECGAAFEIACLDPLELEPLHIHVGGDDDDVERDDDEED